MPVIRQQFDKWSGLESNTDRVHKEGFSDDSNGRRWSDGAWHVRLGMSYLSGGTSPGTAITSIGDYVGHDGARVVSSVQGAKWIVATFPEVPWGD